MFAVFKTSGFKLRFAQVLVIVMAFAFYLITVHNYGHVLPLRGLHDVQYSISSWLRGAAGSTASSGVRVFSTDHYNCTYLLPFRLSDGNLSKICTRNPDTDWIPRQIKAHQGFESNLVDDIIRVLGAAQRHLRNKTHAGDENPKVSLVDVGSNIGVFTLTAASAGYEVLAVDAVKDNLQLLATTLHLAGLTSRVTLLNNAISDVRGNVSMQVVDEHDMGRNMLKQEIRSGQPGNDDANIRAIHMNDLIPYVRSRHVVIKMDIEGSEEKAISSAGDFFEKVDVFSVLMEWGSHYGDSGARIIHFMTRRGFMPYTDSRKMEPCNLSAYSSWPGNVVFIK